ncbi:MAG: hypothetical protein HY361_01550 [Candidatus Aenigmarchaeota archaeon]|nr:hypothetical protein [Candidatus Aenigmarchaeota archaeon]
MAKVRLKMSVDGNRRLIGNGRYEIGKSSFVTVPEEVAIECQREGIYEVEFDKYPAQVAMNDVKLPQ